MNGLSNYVNLHHFFFFYQKIEDNKQAVTDGPTDRRESDLQVSV